MADQYFKEYIAKLNKNLNSFKNNEINFIKSKIFKLNKKNKLIFLGNGGSASICSHLSTDFTKVAKIKAINFNEANHITCFANDFGHDNWMSKSLEFYCDKKDIVFLISSSGNSKNIINAANYCKKNSIYLITLSGFYGKNKLSKLGNINLIVNSKNFNHIEMTHNVWLLGIMDEIINAQF